MGSWGFRFELPSLAIIVRPWWLLVGTALLWSCVSEEPNPGAELQAPSIMAPTLRVQALPIDQPSEQLSDPLRDKPADPAPLSAETVAVVVLLRDGETAGAATSARTLLGAGDDWTMLHAYEALGAFAVRVSPAAAARLANHPAVAAIVPDRQLQVGATAGDVVQATKARVSLGLKGSGVRVAVLDTGVDNQHPDLAGRVVAQQCFCQSGCPGGGKQSGNAQDAHGHGTHVASVLAGAGKVAPIGIAPEAKLVAIRVFGKTGTGPTSDLLAGLNWLVAHATALQVRIVNLSLGSDELFAGPCDSQDPVTAKALALLAKKGVTVFAAAGNDGSTWSIAAPACLSQAVAVGATYAGNYGPKSFTGLCKDSSTGSQKIACFSNRSKMVTVVAPGAFLVGAGLGGGTTVLAGTSQATPVAAAVAALLIGCKPALTVSKLRATLQNTAKPIKDPISGLTLGLVQAGAAALAVCP
ncbi:MAG: hypothetical protein EXR77_08220 [Myxococcales bacterium]|nr:hypothetical protein [Myxococcales bacterium]